MIINDLDGYYIVFDTKNWNTELDTLSNKSNESKVGNKFLLILGHSARRNRKLDCCISQDSRCH